MLPGYYRVIEMSILELTLWIKELFAIGGAVMLPLVLCTLILWYGVGYRFWAMKDFKHMGVRDVVKRYQQNAGIPADNRMAEAVKQGIELKNRGVRNLRRHLDETFYGYEREIAKFAAVTRVVVLIAPLLGLLGTVTGMIETFQSLSTMTLHSQSGGIAGGIAEALFTTQMGLTVAVPGVLANSLLNRKQQQIEQDLSQIKDVLCHHPIPTKELICDEK